MSRKPDRIHYGDRYIETEARIMALLIEHDSLASSELQEMLGMPRTALMEYVREMVSRGTIQFEGTFRNRRYVAPAGAEFWYVPPPRVFDPLGVPV